MSKRHLTSLVLTLATGGVALPTLAAENYILWDNFNNATAINPDRWQTLERTRQVKDGVVRFVQRDIGTQAGDITATFASWNMNGDADDSVRQLRAVVTMTDYEVVGCTANTSYPTFVQARIFGEFFNAGGSAPSSRVNDVLATVRLYRSSDMSGDPAANVKIEGVVAQCTNADCQGNDGVVAIGTVDLGTTTLGTAETLRVEWEKDQKRFNFQRGSAPKQSVSYVLDDSQPPYQLVRLIGTRTQVASCLSGPRGVASVSAKFDNIAVNNSAATP